MPQIRIGEYLLRRVKELGVESIFGVPGDYELALLELVPKAGLKWKGNANELVAAYAADGYARVNGIGALVTTFGPGELSALNAIGGSYAESLPIVHIVGYPALQAVTGKMVIHHTLGVPNYTAYHEMSKHITCASTVIDDPSKAVTEIDRVLNEMLYHSKPVYIGIHGDVAYEMMDDITNPKPLQMELPENDPADENKAIEAMKSTLEKNNKPLAIIDCGTLRAGALDTVMEFVEKFQIPFAETSMTKGFLNEKHPLFIGHYPGLGTSTETIHFIAESNCLLWFGPFLNDLNTPTVIQDIKGKSLLLIHRTHLVIDDTQFKVNMKGLISTFLSHHQRAEIFQSSPNRRLPPDPYPEVEPPSGEIIKQDWLWSYLTHLFRPGDVLVTETGTTGVNIRRTLLPTPMHHATQKLWGSIGFAAGASLGAFVAANELNSQNKGTFKRNILFTGDGSLQMTVQVFGDLLRYRTNAYVFVINNDGYAIERAIHGPKESYNDIAPWRYELMPEFFGAAASKTQYQTYKIHTPKQLDELLKDEAFAIPDKLRVVEIYTGKFDYGVVLDVAGPRGDRFNIGLLPEEDVEATEGINASVGIQG